MNNPLVSIVIPTHNRLSLLQESVASVLAQSYPRWELIVVDDASEDGTWQWLQTLNDPRVRVLRQFKHRERSAARNRGLNEAEGQYVLFLDDDDLLLPEAVEVLVRGLQRCSQAVFAAGGRVLFDGAGRRQRVAHPRIGFTRSEPWRDVLIGWVAVPGQTLFRASALREVGGWCERLATSEDQELLLRVGLRGACLILPLPVLLNRFHSGQWRPKDTADVEDQFRQEFVCGLESSRRQVGERLLQARGYLKEGQSAYQKGRFRDAVIWLTRAIVVAPDILFSPLVGPGIAALWLKAVAGAVVGPRAFERAKVAVRGVLGNHLIAREDGVSVRDRSARLDDP